MITVLSTIYDWSLIWQYRFDLLSGLEVALEVAAAALVISVVAGVIIALGRMLKPPYSWIPTLYINLFRGVPALVSVIWVYFGWSLVLGINFTVFEAGVIALSLLYSAFLAEIFRSAFLAIPKGQWEAGAALGMGKLTVFFSIILPQAAKIALPNVGSMFIGMVKDTSTFTVIGLLEVVHVTQTIVATTFQPFVLYTAAAGLYVMVAFALDYIFRGLEKTLSVPPTGSIAKLLTSRKIRRVERIVEKKLAEETI
jgi:His/Glu/Gln/Arg/opine family amino acid ABC transporter permease subunit